ncbi:MAG: cytochrome c family protein [Alphaproteobacteria bacterium PA4]|nr:MAG: cytochrome c family protein [Alphaproteobacteria bacterium PA4]
MVETLMTNVRVSMIGAAVLAAAVAAPAFAQAMPAGDAKRGEAAFAVCKTCHVVDKGVNRIGPSLFGVVGRKASMVPGYSYSAANKKSGLTWTPANLFKYLEAPQKMVPGTKMTYAGLKDAQKRADVIAFLATKK